ncbi:MAG: metal dependent phosphohydrolase [Chitinophagaceae bacterium]|nr:metal dependent phosphohydrolase [Chitinophagaceae bacterium]
MQFEKAYTFLIEKLHHNLQSNLTYHNADHTLAVIEVADELAQREGVDEYHRNLLKTAALFHDSGFLKVYNNHEAASCDLARKYLPQFEYNTEEIQLICSIIMKTKLPQTPVTPLESIICDADLHYLGKSHYFETAEKLFLEFTSVGWVKSRGEWVKKQIEFLKTHQYFTNSANLLFSHTKEANLKKIQDEQVVVHKRYNVYSSLQDAFFMLLGVVFAGFALKGFLVPNNFFDGGVTGLSLLLHELYHFNLAYLILILNLPLIITSYFWVSKHFALKTLLCVILLGICLLWIPYPTITSDKLLISIFGGVFLGMGIGFTMRAGCAVDGIEVLALYTWKRTSFTITETILLLNIILFSVAAFKFGMETALYSILTYFTASKTIDFVIEGIEAYTGVTIISGSSEIIKHKLVNELGRGITVYKGERGFLPGNFNVSSDCDIIFTVITRLELRKLKNLVYEIDPKAFVFANTIKEASGGIIKRRHIH